MTTSPYSQINSVEGEIRLLILEPAKRLDAPITCRLDSVFLSSDPNYEALSYTWGSPGDGHDSTINGVAFWVWENAEAALRRLRRKSKARTLWVDSICINQKDEVEKGHQLLLMQSIYRQAQQVCVWLGELTDGARIGMQKLTGGFAQWKAVFRSPDKNLSREHGDVVAPTLKHLKNYASGAGIVEMGDHQIELESGEIRELLSRPWWSRVWIIQEAVLAKKLVLMCGSESAPWDSIEKLIKREPEPSRNTVEMFGIQVRPYETLLEGIYQTINVFRTKLSANQWDVSIYELLYDFRGQGCGNPRDRIYGFLGIAPDIVKLGIVPNYSKSITTAQVYASFAKALIRNTGTLEILNCKREWKDVASQDRPVFAWSVFDQAKYHDPSAPISDGPNLKPRMGWSRLPPGWERVKDGTCCHYYDWNTRTVHAQSPLQNQPPAPVRYTATRRACPKGWERSHDNLGRIQLTFNPILALDPKYTPQQRTDPLGDEMANLPSWAPNFANETHIDPEPLLDWSQTLPRYLAAGPAPAVLGPDADSTSLVLGGIAFDKIEQITESWHPETHIPQISRTSTVLQSWEDLALRPVPQCPYGGLEGRRNALWRTYLGDYAGNRAAPQSHRWYVECWYDRVGWAKQIPSEDELTPKNFWKNAWRSISARSELDFIGHLCDLKFADPSILESTKFSHMHHETAEDVRNYGKYIRRIQRVCAHRRMFVTENGYLGLAPWNAKVGDIITVLSGGKTPFLLRSLPTGGVFELVGESFVYGIMGGEVFAGEAAATRLQSFRLV